MVLGSRTNDRLDSGHCRGGRMTQLASEIGDLFRSWNPFCNALVKLSDHPISDLLRTRPEKYGEIHLEKCQH